jgi:hypothetical protein
VHHTNEGTFRSPWHCPMLVLSLSIGNESADWKEVPLGRGDFVYESILLLWLRAWANQVEKINTESDVTRQQLPIMAFPSGDEVSQADPMFMFHSQLDFLLPLCLKSIVLRYGQAVRNSRSRTKRVVVDQGHISILESFVEMLALSLMGQGMGDSKSHDKDKPLQSALAASDNVLDFLTGLCAVFHPAHMEVLIRKFFRTLRDCETECVEVNDGAAIFEWTEENLHRIKCSRQIRLRAVEKLAVLPNFVALNYPLRFSSRASPGRAKKASWTMQYSDPNREEPLTTGELLHDNEDLLPRSGWLAEILTRESLSICALSCEAVVAEAMAHMETQETTKRSTSKSSSLKKRPTATLKRDDLLMFQSIAIHAITCVHELLLRRHAMDKRFQKESSRGRIAALFAKPIFDKSIASVRWLARMESTHRVRSLWLLCFVYILQEAPENLLREAISSYSNSKVHLSLRFLSS